MNNKTAFLLIIFLIHAVVVLGQVPELVDQRYHYSDTAMILNDIKKAEALPREQIDSALQIYGQSISHSHGINFNYGIIVGNINMGHLLYTKGKYTAARQHFDIALHYLENGHNTYLLPLIYNNIGVIYAHSALYDSAVQVFLKAAKHVQRYPNSKSYPLENIYSNLSLTLKSLRQYEKALQYIDYSNEISSSKGNFPILVKSMLNKGNIYHTLKQIPESRALYDSAIILARKHRLYEQLFIGLANIGNLYLEAQDTEMAINYLSEAKNMAQKASSGVYEETGLSLLLAKAYTQVKRFTLAESYLKEAWTKGQAIPVKKAEVLKVYADFYSAQGMDDKAMEKLKEFVALKDSINDNELSLRTTELEIQYQTAEKDREIANKRLQLLKQQASLKESRMLITAGIIIFLLITVLLFISRKNIKNKLARQQQETETRTLEAAIKSEQKERNRIAIELHDGIVSELTAVKLGLETTAPLPEHDIAYRKSLTQLGTTIHSIHNIAYNLMPEALLKHSLATAVNILCNNIERTGQLHIRFLAYGDFDQIKTATRQSIYRIIQELLHNILKHAKADRALVQLSCHQQLFTATVEDNGIGLKETSWKAGLGLESVKKRIRDMNGYISLNNTSSFDTGLSVYMELEV